MTTPINPDLILNTLELAFVVYMADEFLTAPDFPLDRAGRLIEAISEQYGGVEVSDEDLLNHLFEKYNVQ